MDVAAIGSNLSIVPSAPAMTRATPAHAGFTQVMNRAMEEITAPSREAEQAIRNLAVGQTDNVHQVLLAVSQADLAFRMVLEIRNRLMEAYQEIQRMQV